LDVFQWIEEVLHPRTCSSVEFIYEDMESQSGRSLPIVYQPFEASSRGHWRDRGALFDFLYSVQGEGKRLLDFGPGDGWPSLIVAPWAAEVVGVDGSEKRVFVCTENARRLGISNAKFVYAAPDKPLPFDDESFDGIMAASAIEQTPDPHFTVGELFRVLRPGGRLRISYESLGQYSNGLERDLWLWGVDSGNCRLLLFDRDLEHERVRQYGLSYALSRDELVRLFSPDRGRLSFAQIGADRLEIIAPALTDARVCETTHPSGATLRRWLLEIGFGQVLPTHSGSAAAGALFDMIPETLRPHDLLGVDRLVSPVAKIVSQLAAPLSVDPMLTAVK
jgi:SAM-dependent methyltransferase